MIERQAMYKTQKALLDLLVNIVRQYEDIYYKCPNQRHRKTIITLEGDRYKITDYQTKWRNTKATTQKSIDYGKD